MLLSVFLLLMRSTLMVIVLISLFLLSLSLSLSNTNTNTHNIRSSNRNHSIDCIRITWFKWFMPTNPIQGLVEQHSIIYDSQEALNGLCEYECLRGVDICPFNTLLRAEFYWTENGKFGLTFCQFEIIEPYELTFLMLFSCSIRHR